jgi:hypothetical protein
MGFLTSQWSGHFRAAHRRAKLRMDDLSPLAEKIRAAVFLLALGLLVAAYAYSYWAGCAWDGKQGYGDLELGLQYEGVAVTLVAAPLASLVAAALANVRRAPAQAIAFVIFVLIVGGAFSTYLMLDASTRGVVACKPGEKCTKPLPPKD